MSKHPNPTTPAAALDYLAAIYAHCEGIDSAPCDMWLEDDRGRIVLELCDLGTIQKARKAVELLGGWARPPKQRTVYRYRNEAGGWFITSKLREDQPAPRSYTIYQTIFRKLPRRLWLAVQLDPDDYQTAV